MSEQRKTCFGCRHLMYVQGPIGVNGCCEQGHDRAVLVPQKDTAENLTFWRVPSTCPLPSDEVLKSNEKQHWKDWDVINIADVTLTHKVDLKSFEVVPV